MRVALSGVLGTTSVAVIGLLSRLPYGTLRDTLTDALSMPGALVARLLYSEGIHTGHGSPNWGLVALLANAFCYAALWFALLSALLSRRRHPSP